MESWQELPNPQDLKMVTSSPDYAAWQSLRESEDARYIGLTLPRVLARLPYGPDTIPVKASTSARKSTAGTTITSG